MTPSSPREPSGRRVVRVPGFLGCLVALVALPLALLAAVVGALRAVLGPRQGGFASRSAPSMRTSSSADVALCEFVRKMSLDDAFDVDDARMAGLPIDRDVTVETLIRDGLARGWIERRGARFAVTSRGRSAAEQHLQLQGL